MPTRHTVRQGECISAIAARYGFFPVTIWDDGANSQIKDHRKDSNVLYPGDVVVIPDKRLRSEPAATEQRHRFRRKGVPEKLMFQILEEGQPRANEPYVLDIDGHLTQGTTDADGGVVEPIPPNARKARLLLGEEQKEYVLDLGYLDPIDQLSGVQTRLNNLGFDCGAADGVLGPTTEAALKTFQKEHLLEETGTPDHETKQKLVEAYGR
jgi:hypothetical protein